MLMIRLLRVGKKNSPSFRVVLVERGRSAKSGKFIEILGNRNPKTKITVFNKDRILYWLQKGAQVSPTVHNLLVGEKVLESKKVKAWRPKVKAKEAQSASQAQSAPVAPAA